MHERSFWVSLRWLYTIHIQKINRENFAFAILLSEYVVELDLKTSNEILKEESLI